MLEQASADRVAEILRQHLAIQRPPYAVPGQRCVFYLTFPQPWSIEADIASNTLTITGTPGKVEDVRACAVRLDHNWQALKAIPHRSAR